MGQHQVTVLQFVDGGIQWLPGHAACEQHTGKSRVGGDACSLEPGPGHRREQPQDQPLEHSTTTQGEQPEFQGQVRRQRLSCGADPVDIRLLKNHIQHQWNKVNVLMAVHTMWGFTAQMPVTPDLMADG